VNYTVVSVVYTVVVSKNIKDFKDPLNSTAANFALSMPYTVHTVPLFKPSSQKSNNSLKTIL